MSRRSLKPGRRRCCDFLRYAATDWKVAYRQLKKPKQIEIIRNQTGDDADSCKGIFFVQDKTKDSIMDRNRWFQEGLHSKTWHSSKHSQLSCLLSASLLVEYRIVKITSCLTRLRSQHSGLKSRVYSSGRHPSLTNRPCWQWFFHQVRNHRAATYTNNSREFFAKTLRLAICYLQFANSWSKLTQIPYARQWTFAVARQSSFMVAQADGGVCLCSRPAVCIVVAHLVWMTRMKVGQQLLHFGQSCFMGTIADDLDSFLRVCTGALCIFMYSHVILMCSAWWLKNGKEIM